MNVRRLLYWLLLATGLLCAVVVISTGIVLAVRLSMLQKPAELGAGQTNAEDKTSAGQEKVEADPRRRFAPEPVDPSQKEELVAATAKPPLDSVTEEQNPPMDPPKPPPSLPAASPPPRKLTDIERASGSFFGPMPADPLVRPQVVEIVVPDIPGNSAIWGATGRDDRGRIWYGVTCESSDPPSAHLMELDPATCQSVDRGNVVNELKRLGLARPDDQQTKIHSKIVQAEDGHLYFSSMDEAGELALEGKPPTFGSHLWRFRLADYRWEHLAAVPEGLIAVGTGGRFVYALGYYGHVLYQYDIQTGVLRKVRVGSTAGHVSRNFLVDARGHAYVPRLVAPTIPPPFQGGAGGGSAAAPPVGAPKWLASLVEYDAQLKEIGESPLPNYLDPKLHPENSHGIVSLSPLADGSLTLLTHVGHLYRVTPPQGEGRATVESEGWMHPAGACYTASLFSYDGQRWLLSAGRRGEGKYEWLARDQSTGQTLARDLTIVDLFQPSRRDVLLYGSATRDFQGRFYLGGRFVQGDGGSRPMLMRIEP